MASFRDFSIGNVSFICFLIFLSALLAGCQTESTNIRSNSLLNNVVSEDGKEYMFEQIPWFTEKEDLIANGHIPSSNDDNVSIQADGESFNLKKKIKFKHPISEAFVIYKFQDGLFVGGEYIVIAENEENLIQIGTDLKKELEEHFPKPLQDTLDGLSEESIRAGNTSIDWLKNGDHMQRGSLQISIPTKKEKEYIIIISVSAPKEMSVN